MNTDLSNPEAWQRAPRRNKESIKASVQRELRRDGSQRTVEYVHCYEPADGRADGRFIASNIDCAEIWCGKVAGESAEVRVPMTSADVSSQAADRRMIAKLADALSR